MTLLGQKYDDKEKDKRTIKRLPKRLLKPTSLRPENTYKRTCIMVIINADS